MSSGIRGLVLEGFYWITTVALAVFDTGTTFIGGRQNEPPAAWSEIRIAILSYLQCLVS